MDRAIRSLTARLAPVQASPTPRVSCCASRARWAATPPRGATRVRPCRVSCARSTPARRSASRPSRRASRPARLNRRVSEVARAPVAIATRRCRAGCAGRRRFRSGSISSIANSVNTERKESSMRSTMPSRCRLFLHPLDELIGRRTRLDRFGRFLAQDLTAARERAARMPGQVHRDLKQERSLRAGLHVVIRRAAS